MVGRLESTFLRRLKGKKVFTYHNGRLLSHSISFYQHHTRYHVNGFGGCWWGLHFMQGKYRYGCAPVRRFRTVSSRKIRPSDCRLSFLPKLLPHVLTLIQYKVSDNEYRRALAQQRQDWEEEAEPAVKTRHQKNQGIQSIKQPRWQHRVNTFNMINLDAVKSLTHCLFGLSAEQRDDRMGVSTEKAHSTQYGDKQTTLSYTTHLI